MGRVVFAVVRAVLAAVVLVISVGVATAGEAEVRTFSVTVDGKPSGNYKFALSVADDGTETIAAIADVKVRVAILTYIYTLNSLETWKNGKLQTVNANSNNDGKKASVTVAPGEGGLDLTINGKSRRLRADVLTSTGWKLPAGADKTRELVLFDTDDATETPIKFEPLGACRKMLNGQAIEGQRYRLTGKKVDTEWWHDAKGRPIRMTMNWDGHKVVMDLTAITH